MEGVARKSPGYVAAVGIGIVVENAELQAIIREERQRVAERRGEPHAAQTFATSILPAQYPAR